MFEPSLLQHPSTPCLLVSVRDAGEARIAVAGGAHLVDAKDPARGALGALSGNVVRAIVAGVGDAAVTSAVAGEPLSAEALVAKATAMAATKVDYVKVALPADLDDRALAQAAVAARGRLIGVFFAEDGVALDRVRRLAAAGFCGVMVDTRGKDGRRLTDLAGPDALAGFVAECRSHGLMCGLAGSLRIADIPELARHGADYLGFRGGLCRGDDRREALDPARIAEAAGALRALACRDAA